jgi:hypothetical protein
MCTKLFSPRIRRINLVDLHLGQDGFPGAALPFQEFLFSPLIASTRFLLLQA